MAEPGQGKMFIQRGTKMFQVFYFTDLCKQLEAFFQVAKCYDDGICIACMHMPRCVQLTRRSYVLSLLIRLTVHISSGLGMKPTQ